MTGTKIIPRYHPNWRTFKAPNHNEYGLSSRVSNGTKRCSLLVAFLDLGSKVILSHTCIHIFHQPMLLYNAFI